MKGKSPLTIETLKNALPDYAKDLRLNLSSLAAEPALTDQQRAGAFVASAIAARNPDVIAAVSAEYAAVLSTAALSAAKAAAAIMSMNNIYYRFTHLVENEDYRTMPARLRMNIIGNPGVDKVDFELWSLAVSAINGCGMCVAAHEREVRKHGVTAEVVQAVVRIAAVVHAVAVVMDGEISAQPASAQAA